MGKAKPRAPAIETALFWAGLANLAKRRAEQTRIALEVGDFKLTGSAKAEAFLGGRRKPRPVEVVLSADVRVDKPQAYSSRPRETAVLAGLLAIVDKKAPPKTARAIRRAISSINVDKLDQDQLDEADELLDSLKRTKRGVNKRVAVRGKIDEVPQ